MLLTDNLIYKAFFDTIGIEDTEMTPLLKGIMLNGKAQFLYLILSTAECVVKYFVIKTW